ncbi:MAG TPA: acyl-CoA dehydrogenase family protein, partial [Isosphaeraceae bacterium]|nr:acyl-CoA dehydrogenase family protein [Isosphaeraceae bacterium]
MNPTTASAWDDTPRDLDFVRRLAEADGPADASDAWPEALWSILVEWGAPRWSLPATWDGVGLEKPALVAANARVAKGSLTAAFILSQHDAAVRRLLLSGDRPTATYWLDAISTGEAFATVGLSQLTTSRRAGLAARVVGPGGFELLGAMPWVTAAERADVFVGGAVLDDGRQILFALPADRAGVTVRPAYDLAALGASRTSEVACDHVELAESDLLAGPSPDVMQTGPSVGTGGLETSALAVGQALAALEALEALGSAAPNLAEPVEALRKAWDALRDDLDANARGVPDAPNSAEIRTRANALVLRLTQAYLTARKGSGFLRSDPAQRWARQALFFLVWSCPRPVADAAIRDMAGLCHLA